jgi:hypothetical protein
MGLALAPKRDGKVLTPEMFEELPATERERIQHELEGIQNELEAIMQQVPRWEREHREVLRNLNRETTGFAIAHLMEELRAGYRDLPKVIEYIDAVNTSTLSNATSRKTPTTSSAHWHSCPVRSCRPRRTPQSKRGGSSSDCAPRRLISSGVRASGC